MDIIEVMERFRVGETKIDVAGEDAQHSATVRGKARLRQSNHGASNHSPTERVHLYFFKTRLFT